MIITFRKAVDADIDFITDGIIQAELSGGTVLPYTALFNISREETISLIHAIMEEDIEGQEWFLPGFTILEVNGQPAACLNNWIEGNAGMGSGLLKAQAMSWILKEKWKQAAQKLEWLKTLQLPRIQTAMQLECIYTKSEFRGLGLASKLIEHCIKETSTSPAPPKTAEIQLLGNNESALHSYTKCGFLLREQITSARPEILTLLAHNTRVSLVKPL
ncbi:MAG: GNAT family N-acetyltransferase [Bacteroidetes bacterium]|nr:GNAT family N-acetyltransferase [Bacteroidota bacterium]